MLLGSTVMMLRCAQRRPASFILFLLDCQAIHVMEMMRLEGTASARVGWGLRALGVLRSCVGSESRWRSFRQHDPACVAVIVDERSRSPVSVWMLLLPTTAKLAVREGAPRTQASVVVVDLAYVRLQCP